MLGPSEARARGGDAGQLSHARGPRLRSRVAESSRIGTFCSFFVCFSLAIGARDAHAVTPVAWVSEYRKPPRDG